MTFNSFSIFLTVVEEMDFTKAARKLFITQQSLSGHIRRLEEEYGVTLFERKPVLKLTPEGRNMVFYARQILQAENMMISGFADINKNSAAYLTIGISYMRSAIFGSGIWKRFHKKYPNIEVRFSEKNTDRLLEELQRGDLSAMVGIDLRPMSGFRVEPLVDEQIRCIVRRSLIEEIYEDQAADMIRKFQAEGIRLEEIKEIPMLFPPKGNRLRVPLEQVFRQAGVMPRSIFRERSAGAPLPSGPGGRRSGGRHAHDDLRPFQAGNDASGGMLQFPRPERGRQPHFPGLSGGHRTSALCERDDRGDQG